MKKWRTALSCSQCGAHRLTEEQTDYIGVKVGRRFKVEHYRYSDARFIRGRSQCFNANSSITRIRGTPR